MDSLKKRTLEGLSWSGCAQLIKQLITFITGVILARLLSPHEFGLIAMVVVFTGFTNMLMELGLGAAIIQKEDIRQSHLSSIFWLNFACGTILTITVMGVSPLIAHFYGEPALRPLTMLMSLNFLIGSFKVVQYALLNRKLGFKRLAIFETISTVVAGTIGIAMALNGFGVWSLVFQSLILSGVDVLLLWGKSAWRPSFQFDLSGLKEVLGFGLNFTGHGIVDYWARNIDNLLIGRFLGTSPLGIYAKAYRLMLLPLNQISSVVSRVMFPIFSSIKHDKVKIKRLYLKAISYIALVTFPLMLGLLVVAHPFVLVVFGPKWEPVTPILQVFCTLGMVYSIGTTVGWIYMSQGRTDLMFRWGIFASILKVLGIVIGLRWGMMGVAAGHTLVSLLFLTYPGFAIPGRLIGMTFGEMIRSVASIFGCATAMAITVWAFGQFALANQPYWAFLAVQVPLGVLVYVFLIHIFRLKAYLEVSVVIGPKQPKISLKKHS